MHRIALKHYLLMTFLVIANACQKIAEQFFQNITRNKVNKKLPEG